MFGVQQMMKKRLWSSHMYLYMIYNSQRGLCACVLLLGERSLWIDVFVSSSCSRSLWDHHLHEWRVCCRDGCGRVHRSVRSEGSVYAAEVPVCEQERATHVLREISRRHVHCRGEHQSVIIIQHRCALGHSTLCFHFSPPSWKTSGTS